MSWEVGASGGWAQAHFFVGVRFSAEETDMAETARMDAVRAAATRVAVAAALELVDVEIVGSGGSRTLRVFLDKPSGVTHADCELVSRQLADVLDAEEPLGAGGYVLEVSSPGLDRRLTRREDFHRFTGQKAKLILVKPRGTRRNFTGRLVAATDGVADDKVRIQVDTGEQFEFEMAEIQRANLVPEW